MAIKIGDNFNYQGEKFNFERDGFATLEEMNTYPDTSVPNGFVTFCAETNSRYQYFKGSLYGLDNKWIPLRYIPEVEYNDINDVRIGGIYYVVDSALIGSNEGSILIVAQYRDNKCGQFFFRHENLKYRTYKSDNGVDWYWSDWETGGNGKSAYEIAIGNGFVGTEKEWIASLKGPRGPMGEDGKIWKPSVNQYGYLSWTLDSSTSAPEEYLVKGPQGTPGRDGAPGKNGANGVDGLSAYEIAVKNGFVGTEEEWLESLKGSGTGGNGLTEAQKTFLGVSGDLQTESKVSLPDAINEVAGEVQKVWNELHSNNYGSDWYGVIRSGDVATPDLIRIGNMLNHRTLPYHDKIRPCIVRSDRTIAYFLDNNDITKKADGTDAVLDGTDGVMCVYYPAGYIIMASGQGQNLDLNAISLTPFAVNGVKGERFEAFVVSMDYATVRRSDNALMCVINETEDYAGSGSNNTAGGIGYPRTSVNNYNYTLYARKYGSGWTNSFFYFEQIKTTLMIIEYATYNLAKAYNASLSAEGFKQGGFGAGPQNWGGVDWNIYNGYNPVVKIGEVQKHISGLSSNGTGVYTKTIQATETKSYTTSFPCWRWCSSLWGHLWRLDSGVDIDLQPNASDTPYSTIYYTKQPTEVLATNDSDFTFVEKYIKIGLLPRSSGNFKELIGGAFLPKSNGGGSVTWGCAYFWTSIPASRERRGVLSGASLINGGNALRASASSISRPSFSHADFGSLLSAYVAE